MRQAKKLSKYYREYCSILRESLMINNRRA